MRGWLGAAAAAGVLVFAGCAQTGAESTPETTSSNAGSQVPAPPETSATNNEPEPPSSGPSPEESAPEENAPYPSPEENAPEESAPSPEGESSPGECPNGTYENSNGNTICDPYTPENGEQPAGATAECEDGTYSFSEHRSGTCSDHGGVKRWLNE